MNCILPSTSMHAHSPLNPAHPPFVWIDNPPSPAYPLPVLHPLLPSVCLFALLNDCLSCFLSVYCTTKPALYTYIAFSSLCISFCLSACVRLSVFAITSHAISVSVCGIPPVCTNRLLILYCRPLHHNACTFLLVTLNYTTL